MPILLKTKHILLDAKLVKEVFGDEEHVNFVFYPERNQLLLAAKSKLFFEKLHKTAWLTLKLRNPSGDRSMPIHTLLLDYEIDEADRELSYELKNTGILSINL